jgi:hypothetical protein
MKYLFYSLFLIGFVSCGEKEQYHLLVVEQNKFHLRTNVLCQYTMVDTGFVRKVIYNERTFNPYNHRISPFDYRVINNQYLVRENGNHIFNLEVDSFVFSNDNQGFLIDLTNEKMVTIKDYNYHSNTPMLRFENQDTIPNQYSKLTNASFIVFDFNLGRERELDAIEALEYINQGIYSPDKSKRIILDSLKSIKYPAYDNLNCSWTRNFFVDGIYSIKNEHQDIMSFSISYIDNLWTQPIEVPILWIDNHRFITQQENNQLILVNTETKQISKFPKIEGVELCALSKFETDVNQDIYFSVENEDVWKIDIKNVELNKVDSIPIAKNVTKNAAFRNLRTVKKPNYFYKGNPILDDTLQTEYYDIIDNYIAIQCGERSIGNYDDYYFNIKVFNTETESLKILKIKNMKGWIGWIKR